MSLFILIATFFLYNGVFSNPIITEQLPELTTQNVTTTTVKPPENPKEYEVAEMVTNSEVSSFCASMFSGQQVMNILFVTNKTDPCPSQYKFASYSKLVARVTGETLFKENGERQIYKLFCCYVID